MNLSTCAGPVELFRAFLNILADGEGKGGEPVDF